MRGAFSRGFTLLEIMVVVAIVGIFVGVTVLSTDLVAFERRLEQQANRLGPLISFATDEALLQSQDFGLLINERSYHFFIFDYELEDWVPYVERPFESHTLESDMVMSLVIDDREVILETAEAAFPRQWEFPLTEGEVELMPDPQILVLSSGEITPFALEFLRELQPFEPGARLDVAFNGKWEVVVGERR